MANDRKLTGAGRDKIDRADDLAETEEPARPDRNSEPLQNEIPADSDLAEAPETRESDRLALSDVHILLVDDTPDMLHVASAILRRSGARVRTVGSAREARQILEDMQPDVIVSDLAMPEEDGFSFIESLRALEKQGARHIPAIALTAFSGPEFRLLSLRAGFEDHLLKPILAETLVNAIQGVLKIRRSIH